MKSVGEVMSIGSNFQESFQKALCSMEEGLNGLNSVKTNMSELSKEEILHELTIPGPKRIFYVADAIRNGWKLDKVHSLTKIDYWFLDQINEILDIEEDLINLKEDQISEDYLWKIKEKGFSDNRIAELVGSHEDSIRALRKAKGVLPIYRRVDTCAAEFATSTCYMYSSYGGKCESNTTTNKKVLVLGSGPNRIGQGIEFDYCCVHASLAMQEEGYESIMVNCNPETVSTDYDVSNRLYFEPITSEKILDIIDNENPEGVIIQFGGQTPLKLADTLSEKGVKVLGTNVDAIDRSEDRERFQELVNKLSLKQPSNATAKNVKEALDRAKEIGFPIVVRPSYVLGGRAMQLVNNIQELEKYLNEAVEVSNSKPILLDSYLTDAIEVDVDVVSDGKNIEIGGILQHIEQAGIHSGDSACALPPYSLSNEIQDKMKKQAKNISEELNIIGLMNIQFAIKDNDIFIIEVNPRASRTVPFISKAIGISLAKVASKAMIGKSLKEQNFSSKLPGGLSFVKEAVMPFDKFPHVDPILGPEMKSTGEVMGIGPNFGEAYAKAQKGANKILRRSGIVFISVKKSDKKYLDEFVPSIIKCGFDIVATSGSADYIEKLGFEVRRINKVNEGRPHVVDSILNNEIDLVINTTEGTQSIKDSASIRQSALRNKIFCTTTMFGASAVIDALQNTEDNWTYNTLQEINKL
jgi:carbamoyl-phosphate synthase large subunit